MAETQLSQVTQPSTCRAIRRLGSQRDRLIRVIPGAPVATRRSSDWAGTWSGTLITSDFPSRPVALPWRGLEFDSGRVAVAQHVIAHFPVLTTAVYGFPSGPTHPQAAAMTDELRFCPFVA